MNIENLLWGLVLVGMTVAYGMTLIRVLSLPIDYDENPLLTERLGNIACPI